MIPLHLRRCLAVAGVCFTAAGVLQASEGCTKAQESTAVQDIPTDLSAIACIAVEAIGGASIPVIAATCAVTDAQVANEILTLLQDGQAPDAGGTAQLVAQRLSSMPAAKDAMARKAAHR